MMGTNSTTAPRKRGWTNSGPIVTIDDANAAIRNAALAFFVVAAIQGLIGIFLAPMMLGDAVLWAVLGALLKRTKSRFVAATSLAWAVVVTALTLLSKAGLYRGSGGTNIFLAAVTIYEAWRGLQGTIVYHRLRGTVTNVRSVVILAVVAAIATIVAVHGTLTVLMRVGVDLSSSDSDALLGAVVILVPTVVATIVFNRWLPFTSRLKPTAVTGHPDTKVVTSG
jgi:hypothetical protein